MFASKEVFIPVSTGGHKADAAIYIDCIAPLAGNGCVCNLSPVIPNGRQAGGIGVLYALN